MSPQTIKILITAVLLLHGIAHGRAFVTLVMVAAGRSSNEWVPMRSWLLPSLSERAAAGIAGIFWLLSTIGFVAAALSFWGAILPDAPWRQLAIASAIISTVGTALFSGIWPGAPNQRLSSLDTAISLAVNLGVIIALVWMQWPPVEMFGK